MIAHLMGVDAAYRSLNPKPPRYIRKQRPHFHAGAPGLSATRMGRQGFPVPAEALPLLTLSIQTMPPLPDSGA